MIPKFRLKSAVPLLLLLFAGSCKTDTDRDGKTDDIDRCKQIPAKTADGCPIKPQISRVHLYLDNSASMSGYYKGATDFKTIVTDLAVKVDKEISPVDIAFIAEGVLPYKMPVNHFPADIATTRLTAQRSSQLHLMIDKIAAGTADRDVSVLVSDCILSFPNAAINANRAINKTDANVLRNNIYGTFIDLKKKGFATSLYAFHSQFNGVYYTYENAPVRLPGTLRPFYVWVIAKKEMLRQFDSRLADISSFQPKHSLHFGLTDGPVRQYHILPQLGRRGGWKKMPVASSGGDTGIQDAEVSKEQPVLFNAVINLDSLPEYAKDLNYLRSYLQLTAPGCHAVFSIRPKSEVNAAKVTADPQRVLLQTSTHSIEVQIDDLKLPSTTVQLVLPLQYDTWYTAWSSMDDRYMNASVPQTFALNYLVDGLMQAYNTKYQDYIRLSFTITQ